MAVLCPELETQHLAENALVDVGYFKFLDKVVGEEEDQHGKPNSETYGNWNDTFVPERYEGCDANLDNSEKNEDRKN